MEALPGKHVWCLRKRKDTGPLTRRDTTHARCGGTWARKAEDGLRPHRDMKHYPKGKGGHLNRGKSWWDLNFRKITLVVAQRRKLMEANRAARKKDFTVLSPGMI